MKNPDIDIDFADRDLALAQLDYVPALTKTSQGARPHVGVYFQDIPVHPLTGHAAYDYQTAGDLGYTKIDFLNLHIYQQIKDEEHLLRLHNTEPLWELLEVESFASELFQLGGHAELVTAMKPQSVEHLAMLLALIRPGKEHLIGKPWEEIEKEIWLPTKEGYTFKKSHAISYALVVALQINLMVEQLSEESNEVD